jgi:hypothetical protein
MRINGIWDQCPDDDKEVGAKQIGNTKRFQVASGEPMSPLANEVGKFGDLEDSPSCELLGHDDNNELLQQTSDQPILVDTENIVEENDLLHFTNYGRYHCMEILSSRLCCIVNYKTNVRGN